MSEFTVALIDSRGDPSFPIEEEVVRAAGGRLVIANSQSDDEVLAVAKGADAILCRMYHMNRAMMEKLEGVKVIVRGGVGFDNLDVDAATDNGIIICNVVDYGYHEVANHAFAMLMALNRKLVQLDRGIRAGDPRINPAHPESIQLPTGRLHGETLGLVAFGRIAQEVAKRAGGFDMRVLAYDPAPNEARARELGVELVDLDTVMRESDYVSVHAPLMPATRNLIGARELGLMKPTAYIVLTSRGGVIDEAALAAAVRGKVIAGAGVDTVVTEPIRSDDPLLQVDNIIVTPHSAYFSQVSVQILRRWFAEAAVDVCRGVMPRHVVNKAVLARFALTPRSAD
ncbi:MAG: C-terminal binding protein [Acidimicrobiia bacterium]